MDDQTKARKIADIKLAASSGKTKPNKKKLTVRVKIYSPFKVYYDNEAYSISAVNDTGPFDVLPQHHNFLTLLSPCDIVVISEHGEQRIKITRGVMHVKANQVVVFLDV